MARLLVLDNSEAICLSLANKIGEIGHEVTVCSNAASALEQIEQNAFRLIIINLHLSESNAFDFITATHSSSLNHYASFIAMTANPSHELLVKSLSLGVSSLFCLPFSFSLLTERMATLMAPQNRRLKQFETSLMRILLESFSKVISGFGDITLVAGKPFIRTHQASINEYTAKVLIDCDFVEGSVCVNCEGPFVESLMRSQKKLDKKNFASAVRIGESLKELVGESFQVAFSRIRKEQKIDLKSSSPDIIFGRDKKISEGNGERILAIPFAFDAVQTVYVEFCLNLKDDQFDEWNNEASAGLNNAGKAA